MITWRSLAITWRSLRGRIRGRVGGLVFGGGCGGLVVPRGNQFFLNLGPLSRVHRRFIAIRGQLVHRKIGTGFLRPSRRVRRRTHQRQIGDRYRATAKRERRQQQRSRGQCPLFSIYRHASGSPHFADVNLIATNISTTDAYFIGSCCNAEPCSLKTIKARTTNPAVGA
jgi:hypothetical protein